MAKLKIGEAVSEVKDIKIDDVEAKTVSVGTEEVTGAPEAKSITVGDTTYGISAGGGGGSGGLEVIDFGTLETSNDSPQLFIKKVDAENVTKMLALAAEGQPFVAKYTFPFSGSGATMNITVHSLVNIIDLGEGMGGVGFNTAGLNMGAGFGFMITIGDQGEGYYINLTVS